MKMDMVELVQKHLAMCGIAISTESPKNHPINLRNSTIFLLLCACIISDAILLDEIGTFDEYTDILFHVITNSTFGIVYVIIVCKTSKLFKYINNLAVAVREGGCSIQF